MKQIEALIMGQSYLLSCPEGSENSMMNAVQKVDTAMCKIRDAAKIKARERIAVLAALNLAFEQPEGEPNSTAQNGNETHSSASERVDLSALIHKLDTVLGQDGQLL
ncbi:MAG: cell division protein ZapA [Polaromonas sp.]|nr:cell division protein ZapA [Polaromonas sp.]MBP8873326.1 cell division protein ZapA [Polaromonas sp.]MBP9831455.1 cell division protein ZapA [Polaromonas sp.]